MRSSPFHDQDTLYIGGQSFSFVELPLKNILPNTAGKRIVLLLTPFLMSHSPLPEVFKGGEREEKG